MAPQLQPETPKCVVTSAGHFLRYNNLPVNHVQSLILSPGGWDTIAAHLKVHQSGVFEYAFQLPDRAERWQVKARWELKNGLCYGTLLEQMPLNGAIAPVSVVSKQTSIVQNKSTDVFRVMTPDPIATEFQQVAQATMSLRLDLGLKTVEGCEIRADWRSRQIDLLCDDIKVRDRVFALRPRIARGALRRGLKMINIYHPGNPLPLRFSSKLPIRFWGTSTMATGLQELILPKAANDLLVIPNRIELERITLDNPNLNTIDLANDTGIMAGANCVKSSGLKPEEWVGRTMSAPTPVPGISTWIPEEKTRFIALLFKHSGCIVEHEYPAYLYDGTPVYMQVRAVLAEYSGAIVRLVETVSSQPR